MSKAAVVEAIGESIAYMKRYGVRVVPWMVDSMRSPETACQFFKAMADAGADGVYDEFQAIAEGVVLAARG